MRLSEAIRLGAMLRPQCFGPAFQDNCSCALGAAGEAMGLPYGVEDWECGVFIKRTWGRKYSSAKMQCPACGKHNDILNLIAHLNDKHKWTREQIADWVESIEPQEAESGVDKDIKGTASTENVKVPVNQTIIADGEARLDQVIPYWPFNVSPASPPLVRHADR